MAPRLTQQDASRREGIVAPPVLQGCKTIDLGQPVAATHQPVAEIVRRQIWPDCPLQRCDHLLRPYFGASTRAISADQLWRKHG